MPLSSKSRYGSLVPVWTNSDTFGWDFCLGVQSAEKAFEEVDGAETQTIAGAVMNFASARGFRDFQQDSQRNVSQRQNHTKHNRHSDRSPMLSRERRCYAKYFFMERWPEASRIHAVQTSNSVRLLQ